MLSRSHATFLYRFTGTILHPQKHKKERLPLKELLSNLPNYPPEMASQSTTTKQQQEQQQHIDNHGGQHQPHNISAPAKVVYRNDDFVSRENRLAGVDPSQGNDVHNGGSTSSSSRRARPVTAYDILQNNNALYGMTKSEEKDPR